MNHALRSLALVLSAVALLTANAHADWTCSTVAQKGGTDSLGGTFKTKFEDPAINSSGDVTFHARVGSGGRRVFLAENGGGVPEVIVSQGNLTPDGDLFRKFGSTSINDNGDIGFFSDLDSGDGVFIREAGGTMIRAVHSGQASPSGGTFDTVQAVSRINDDADIAFMARVSGGPDGIFLYDKSADSVSKVAAVGDPVAFLSIVGFCDFVKGSTVDLSDTGNVAFQAKTGVICTLGSTTGFWLQDGSDFESVADVGGATPIAGTSYNKMFGKPHLNASDKVLFRAKVRPANTCNNPEGNLCSVDGDCDGTCIGGTNALEPCAMDSDCPDTGPEAKCVTPECGGDRCLGGADIGMPCGNDGDCGGNECGEPGQSGKALFLYDPSGPSTSAVAAEKDAAPDTGGGTLKTLAPPGGLSDDDRAAFRSKVRSGSAKHGLFVFNGTDEAAVLATDPVPLDEFALGTVYRKIVEQTGFSRDGAWLTYSARVKEFVPNASNAGLFRCETVI